MDFVRFQVIDGQLVLVHVVTQKHLSVPDVNGLPTNCIAVHGLHCSLGAYIPQEDCPVPSPTQEGVYIGWVPLYAENTIGVGPQLSSLQLSRVALVQMAQEHVAVFPRNHIPLIVTANFAALQGRRILNRKTATFFWKRSWLEVACQYSRVPSVWATIRVFLIMEAGEVLAMHITGLLSSFTKLYWTAFLVVDRMRVVPSLHPRHISPDECKY